MSSPLSKTARARTPQPLPRGSRSNFDAGDSPSKIVLSRTESGADMPSSNAGPAKVGVEDIAQDRDTFDCQTIVFQSLAQERREIRLSGNNRAELGGSFDVQRIIFAEFLS